MLNLSFSQVRGFLAADLLKQMKECCSCILENKIIIFLLTFFLTKIQLLIEPFNLFLSFKKKSLRGSMKNLQNGLLKTLLIIRIINKSTSSVAALMFSQVWVC